MRLRGKTRSGEGPRTPRSRERDVRKLLPAFLVAAFFAALPVVALAHGNAWVFETDTTLISRDGQENTTAFPDRTNLCEGTFGIPFGGDPGWARVGGSPNPNTPFVEARGQVFPDFAHRTNPFVTSTDNPFSHYSFDINVFVTLDAPYRGLLGSGNFSLGGENEHGELEIEWERGGVPLFAYPAPRDRITIWGSHIWDCGHGGPNKFRTEIHPPVGWAVYRNTATASDRDQTPPPGKRTQDPWVWYESTDHQGMGATLPSTGLLNTPVQASVVDAFFSSFGGNVPESLNGCDDSTAIADRTVDAPCLGISGFLANFEWMQPVLNQDYVFFIPAPPKPDPEAMLVWESEDRCSEAPSSPGNPPGDDIDDVGEASDGAKNIGAPTCNIPDQIVSTTVNGQPGVEVTVRAASGGASYPSNGYVALAKRYKVAWDFVPPPAQGVHRFRFDINHLRVYDDAEECGQDGEWDMTMRVNEQWLYPVAGHGDGGDPFYANGAVDDDKCVPFHSATFKQYAIGETFTVSVVPGEPLNFWERSVDIDPFDNDVLPVVQNFPSAPGGYEPGTANTHVKGGHTIGYTVTDATLPPPTLGTLVIGEPKHGPNADTGGVATRVSGSTPIELQGSNGAKLEYRFWKDGDPKPATWTFDSSAPFTVDLGSGATSDGRYTIEFASVSADGIVAQRRLASIELDTTAPTLDLPDPITVLADETGGKVVDYVASTSDNLPGPVGFSCVPLSGSLFPSGKDAPLTTTVTCTATDAVDNTATGTFPVTVEADTTPPTVTCSASPSSLSPSDHRLVTVKTAVRVKDAGSGPNRFLLVSVTTNQPDSGLGRGDRRSDIQEWARNTGDHEGLLRAERFGSTRTYTITYKGMDKAGNSALCRARVKVPL